MVVDYVLLIDILGDIGNFEGHVTVGLLQRGLNVATESVHKVDNLVALALFVASRFLFECTHVHFLNHIAKSLESPLGLRGLLDRKSVV